MTARPSIVILGMLTKIPVGGVAWLVGQYALGFQRLGFDVHYVEAHGRTPSMFMTSESDNGVAKACAYLDRELRRFGLEHRWAYHDLRGGACHGMTRAQLETAYDGASLIINLHGGTVPLEEHARTGRLVYLGTDPVDTEIEVATGVERTISFLEQHAAFFTWGLNYGNPDCLLPWNQQFAFAPSPPPVILDLWDDGSPPGEHFTTVGNWRQVYRDIEYGGERYSWSKHHEFLKVLSLPARVDQTFQLALASYTAADRDLLEDSGWLVTPAERSSEPDAYRDFVRGSRGEFSVAKDQNVRLRSGWFSERSATYLAAGRPVVLQDTGFGSALPTGAGLFAFSDIDDAVAAIELVNSDPAGQAKAAVEIAREHLAHDVVLGDLLRRSGVSLPGAGGSSRPWHRHVGIPRDLVLTPVARRPLTLVGERVRRVLERPIPMSGRRSTRLPTSSVLMVTYENLEATRLAVESVLAHTPGPYELIVVDNGADPAIRRYLGVLQARNAHVRLILNSRNRGFSGAVNQALLASRGEVVALLNNDVMVTPGWLEGLVAHLADPAVGAVGPVTNRCGNEAEVPADYRSYGELLRFSAERAEGFAGRSTSVPMLVMFCTAFRREVVERVGPLDERYEIGMFEDDDYAERLHREGFELRCAEDVFVHHFGEASFSSLYADGRRSTLFERNRQRFESKWGRPWSPHRHRHDAGYEGLVEQVRARLAAAVPPDAFVAVVSKGDDRMVELGGLAATHLPCRPDGSYAGHHPANDEEAIAEIHRLEAIGVTHVAFPDPSRWWLDHYHGLRDHLEGAYLEVTTDSPVVVFERRTGDTEAARAGGEP